MIKFTGTHQETGQPVLGIGLSRANCEKLLAGQAILFSTEGLAGMPPMEIFLMAGDTEESMAFDMLKLGLREPNVTIMKQGGEA